MASRLINYKKRGQYIASAGIFKPVPAQAVQTINTVAVRITNAFKDIADEGKPTFTSVKAPLSTDSESHNIVDGLPVFTRKGDSINNKPAVFQSFSGATMKQFADSVPLGLACSDHLVNHKFTSSPHLKVQIAGMGNTIHTGNKPISFNSWVAMGAPITDKEGEPLVRIKGVWEGTYLASTRAIPDCFLFLGQGLATLARKKDGMSRKTEGVDEDELMRNVAINMLDRADGNGNALPDKDKLWDDLAALVKRDEAGWTGIGECITNWQAAIKQADAPLKWSDVVMLIVDLVYYTQTHVFTTILGRSQSAPNPGESFAISLGKPTAF
jgi:hypothetical protein